MSKQEFLNYIKEVDQIYRKFKKRFINKKYIMKFSNGETIKFNFYEQRFAHLVGIQINMLKETCLIPKNLQSSDILEYIFFNPEKFYQLITENGYKIENFISNYYKKKIMVMKSIKGFFPDNIEFVVDFNRNKAFLVNDELKPNVEYLLGYRASGGYGIIGLKKSAYGDYFPLTVLHYNKNFIKEILKYQTLLLPIYTEIRNKQEKTICDYKLYIKSKIKKLKIYSTVFERKYSCVTNLTEEYIGELEYAASYFETTKEQMNLVKKDNYELQMSNIKLETENERLKAELEELKRRLKEPGKCFDEKYEKLRMDIFDGELIEDEVINKAFKAFTNSERNLLEYYYGLNGKDRKSWKEIASIYEISSIQYVLNKLKKDFKNICLGIKTKNPYIELLTDRQKLLSLAFNLPKEERDAFILKNGLYDCNRANNKEISKQLGIPYVKVKKIIESAEEKVREQINSKI